MIYVYTHAIHFVKFFIQQEIFNRHGYTIKSFLSSLDALDEFNSRPDFFDTGTGLIAPAISFAFSKSTSP
jgi:hypothetical protein